MPRDAVVLDACVLLPIALADTLLRIAEKGLYRPLWSDRILAETQAAIEEIHPGIDVQKRFTELDLSPPTVLQVIHEQAAHTTRPRLTPQDLATLLSRAGVPGFAEEIRRLMATPIQ